MPLPPFDESTKAEALPYEVFEWLCETAMYARSTSDTATEIYNKLKLVLRLLAVRNPNSQSSATRKALGSLIQSISVQEDSEKPCLDLLGLLIRMVDAKQDFKFNAMKHLAISGLGYFMASNKWRMRQMSVNAFVISLDAVKVCPQIPETLQYRNTILWTMTQCVLPTVDEVSLRAAVKFARSMIESAAENTEVGQQTLERSFNLLKALFEMPKARLFEKKMDRWHQLFNIGSVSPNPDVRLAAAQFFSTVLQEFGTNDFKQNVTTVVHLVFKTGAHKSYGTDQGLSFRMQSLIRVIASLIEVERKSTEFGTQLDQWLGSLLLQMEPALIQSLFVEDIIKRKLLGDFRNMDIVSVLLRQLALSQTPNPSSKSSSKSKNAMPRPRVESVLCCLTDAINLLGHSIQPVAYSVHQASLGLILNSSAPLSNVELVSVVRCLVTIVKAAPTLLITTIELCLKRMEIPAKDPRLHADKAYVLGAMIALTRPLALYSDGELTKRAMLIASNQIQQLEDFYAFSVGWNLFYGILSLGPHEVKPLVPQLILMLRSHISAESPEVLEKALSGLLIFLYHNEPLVTPDIANTLGKLLNSLWSRIESKPVNSQIRKRLLQCYVRLLDDGKFDDYPSSLLMRYVAHLTSPKAYNKEFGVQIESAIMVPSQAVKDVATDISIDSEVWSDRNAVEFGLTSLGRHCAGSYGNDVDYTIFCDLSTMSVDSHTAVVDLSIQVCSNILPLQPDRIQESVFDAILSNLENSAAVNTLRKSAAMLNTAQLVYLILLNDLEVYDRILQIIVSSLKILLASPHVEAQNLAAKSCGLLSKKIRNSTVGLQILPSLAKELLEFAVNPTVSVNLRAGSVKALGYISEAWSQQSLVEAHFRVLKPLALDTNPVIHLAAIESMKLALLSPDLVDQKFIKQTLRILLQTYLLESHTNSVKFCQEVADTLIQVVSRFGPLLSNENQAGNRTRIICLADQLQLDSHRHIRVLAWNSLIEVYFYARQGISWQIFIRRWRDVIADANSDDEEVDAAVSGLLMLVRLSARAIFSVAGPSLEAALWLLLDQRPNQKDLRSLIRTWLTQTLEDNNSIQVWIERISAVVMKPRYFFENRLAASLGESKKNGEESGLHKEKAESVDPTAVAADEDVSFGVTADDTSNEQFSWKARKFALDLFIQILVTDLSGKSVEQKTTSVTTSKAGELIKIAFTSATSQILGLQYAGMTLLNEIIVQLGDLTDPDFANISLLEQYQVQIVSALTPAFTADSSPGLALEALRTVATFLGSNVIKNREKLSRLLRILDDSLASMAYEDQHKFRLGQLEMSIDAAKALRIAVLAVWAEIEISSKEKPHLQEAIAPHLSELTVLWTDGISTYGRLQSEVDAQWSQPTIENAIDQISEIQFKMLMKPVFKTSWLKFIRAIATLELIDHPEEHTGLLVILCGLCLQEISKTLTMTSLAQSLAEIIEDKENGDKERAVMPTLNGDESLQAYRLSVLQTLASILTANVARVLIDSSIDYMEENIPLIYRVMLVGQPDEQIAVLTIARNLVAGQPDTDDKVDHFFEILKISVLPLRHLFPQLIEVGAQQRNVELNPSQIQLLRHTMDVVIDIAQVFRDIIKTDLWVCLLKAFEELNHREPALAAPSFKRFLEVLATQVELRGVDFVVDALTVSLKRAVETDSTLEGLFISTAIVCTNGASLNGSTALTYVYRFGLRAAEALVTQEDAAVALQLVTAVLRATATITAGEAFAYGCLPALCILTVDPQQPSEIRQRSAAALTVYAALSGQALNVILPALLTLSDTNLRSLAHSLLLQIVAKQSEVFKQAIWQIDARDRAIAQELLAQESADADELDASDDESEDEITLTTFA